MFFTVRPWCSAIFGLTSSRKWACSRSWVPSSSIPMSREYPATSAASIAAKRRVEVMLGWAPWRQEWSLAWILSLLQMPVAFAGRIFDISVHNISNYTTMIMHNSAAHIRVSLTE